MGAGARANMPEERGMYLRGKIYSDGSREQFHALDVATCGVLVSGVGCVCVEVGAGEVMHVM